MFTRFDDNKNSSHKDSYHVAVLGLLGVCRWKVYPPCPHKIVERGGAECVVSAQNEKNDPDVEFVESADKKKVYVAYPGYAVLRKDVAEAGSVDVVHASGEMIRRFSKAELVSHALKYEDRRLVGEPSVQRYVEFKRQCDSILARIRLLGEKQRRLCDMDLLEKMTKEVSRNQMKVDVKAGWAEDVCERIDKEEMRIRDVRAQEVAKRDKLLKEIDAKIGKSPWNEIYGFCCEQRQSAPESVDADCWTKKNDEVASKWKESIKASIDLMVGQFVKPNSKDYDGLHKSLADFKRTGIGEIDDTINELVRIETKKASKMEVDECLVAVKHEIEVDIRENDPQKADERIFKCRDFLTAKKWLDAGERDRALQELENLQHELFRAIWTARVEKARSDQKVKLADVLDRCIGDGFDVRNKTFWEKHGSKIMTGVAVAAAATTFVVASRNAPEAKSTVGDLVQFGKVLGKSHGTYTDVSKFTDFAKPTSETATGLRNGDLAADLALEAGEFNWYAELRKLGYQGDFNDFKAFSLFMEHSDCSEGSINRYMELTKTPIDLKNWCDETLLMKAAEFGRLPAVRWLCDNGADVNARSKDTVFTSPKTALGIAIEKGHAECVEFLKSKGAK